MSSFWRLAIFSGNWLCQVGASVVSLSPPLAATQYLPLPICLTGENACPPDDVGGPLDYALFLEVLGDRKHEQSEAMLRWIGGVIDPKGFDLNRTNRD